MDMGLRHTFVPGRRQSLKSLIWATPSQLWRKCCLWFAYPARDSCMIGKDFATKLHTTYTPSPIEHCQRVFIIFKGVCVRKISGMFQEKIIGRWYFRMTHRLHL